MMPPLSAVVCDTLFTKRVYTEGRNENIEVEILKYSIPETGKKVMSIFLPISGRQSAVSKSHEHSSLLHQSVKKFAFPL